MMASTSPWPPGAQTAAIAVGGGGGGITWVSLTAADGTQTDTNGLVTSFSDTGGWIEAAFASRAAANNYLPTQNPCWFDFANSLFDFADLVDANGNPRKVFVIRLEIDPTSTVPTDFHLGMGFRDGTISNYVYGGGRWASGSWDSMSGSWFSSSGAGTGGTATLGSTFEPTFSPYGPWDGSTNGSTMGVVTGVGGVFDVSQDAGNWDPTTAHVRLLIGQRNTVAFAGTELLRFKLWVGVAELAAPS